MVTDTPIDPPEIPSENYKQDSRLISKIKMVSSLEINQKSYVYENGKPLDKYLSFELISKSVFDRKRKSAVNFLTSDTLPAKKKNGVIELKCKDKVVRYADRPSEFEDIQEFTYVGQVEFLNKYIIHGSYWEGGDFMFIDKTSGKETSSFPDLPLVSPDKKFMVCLYPNYYDGPNFGLYQIKENKVKTIMEAQFKYWMPFDENSDDKIFWGSDGYLYSVIGFHEEKIPTRHYVRIKIK
jgi:hypothetical protein